LLQREREYTQLHRDTTVQALTLTPSLQDKQLVWQDTPLVRAMMHGRILMVDEADKAPSEVHLPGRDSPTATGGLHSQGLARGRRNAPP
jgi:hypothetical protein